MLNIKGNEDLNRLKQENFLLSVRRRQIRSNNAELQELERNIKKSYFRKDLELQIKERKESIDKSKLQAANEDRLQVENEIKKAQTEEEVNEKSERLKKGRLREDLNKQLADKQKKKVFQYQSYLKEKLQQKVMIEKLEEEEKIKKTEELERKKQTMISLKDYIRKQEEWCKQKQEDEKIEEARITEWNRQKEIVKNCRAEEKRENELKKSHISNLIGLKTLSLHEEKRKREEVLLDLQIEEYKAKNDEFERKNLESIALKREQERLDAIHYMEEILPLKIKYQKQLDQKFYEEEMRSLAEKDKLEQLSDVKRRQKLREHRQSILKMLEEKKRQREEELKRELVEHEKKLKDEEKREQFIHEERIRLLQEHAPFLKDYFPRDMLRDTDREFISLSRSQT